MMTKGEKDFLDQYTRKLMVGMCYSAMGRPQKDPLFGFGGERLENHMVFLDYAVSKKWLSKDMTKILSAGWATASRFLKR